MISSADGELRLFVDVVDTALVSQHLANGLRKVIVRAKRSNGTLEIQCPNTVELVLVDFHDAGDISIVGGKELSKVLTSGVRALSISACAILSFLELRNTKHDSLTSPYSLPGVISLSIQNCREIVPFKLSEPKETREYAFANIQHEIDLATLNFENVDLKTLHFLNCKLTNINEIEKLRNLETLDLLDIGYLRDINFTKHLMFLKRLNLGGDTNVLNGILSDVMRLPNLQYLLFSNRRHYDLRLKEYNGSLNSVVYRKQA